MHEVKTLWKEWCYGNWRYINDDNMYINDWAIKHKNICVGVHWNYVSIPGQKLSQWLENTQRQKEYLVKKQVIFKCSDLSTSLCTSLYGDWAGFTSCLNFRHLAFKWLTSDKRAVKSSAIRRHFFKSNGTTRLCTLNTIVSIFSSCGSLNTVSSSGPPQFIWQQVVNFLNISLIQIWESIWNIICLLCPLLHPAGSEIWGNH